MPCLLHGYQITESAEILGPQCRECHLQGLRRRKGRSDRIDSEAVNLPLHGTSYHRLHDRFALALLDVLPSTEINLPEKIKVIWFGDTLFTAEDLKPSSCLEVRQAVAVAPAVDSPGILSSLTLCMYDMILLRQSTVDNFFHSRKDYCILSVSSDNLRRTALQIKDGGKCDNPTIQRFAY